MDILPRQFNNGGDRQSAFSAFQASLSAQQASQASAASAASAASVASVKSVRSVAAATAAASTTEATSIALDSSTALTFPSTPSSTAPTNNNTPSSNSPLVLPTKSSSSPSSASNVTPASSTRGLSTFNTITSDSSASSGTALPIQISSQSLQPSGSSRTYTSSLAVGAASDTIVPVTGDAHHPSLSSGGLAAAVVVPVLLALLALALAAAFLLLRRRRRASQERDVDAGASGTGGAFIPVMAEKRGHRADMSQSSSAPFVSTSENRSYMTGLDTSSQGSQSHEYYAPRPSHDAPPPYHKEGLFSSPILPEIPAAAALNVPALHEPSETHSIIPPTASRSNFAAPYDFGLLAAEASSRPIPSRSQSHRSIDGRSIAGSVASDLYSETASIHSANVARLSLGPASIVGQLRMTDPFRDPEPSSPVSSLGEEGPERFKKHEA